MSIEHSKCSGYWNFGCSGLEEMGPNQESVNSGFTQLKYGKCDLVKVGVHFESV